MSKTGEDTVTAQEEEGTRTEGRRWGTEASVPDQAWEGLGRLGPGGFFEKGGRIWHWASRSHRAAAPPLLSQQLSRGGPYVRFASVDRPTVTESLRAGLLGHTPALPVIGRAQRGHSERGPGERPCLGMGYHLQLHPGQPHTSPGYTPQRPLPWPPGLSSPYCLFWGGRGGAVFLKGKCDHTILTQDPSMAPHCPQDQAFKAPLVPSAYLLCPSGLG